MYVLEHVKVVCGVMNLAQWREMGLAVGRWW